MITIDQGVLIIAVNFAWFVVFSTLIGLTLWVGRVLYKKIKANAVEQELYLEGIAWLDDHRAKLKGDNRFPVGENYFTTAFHDYPAAVVHKVWLRYIHEQQFTFDPIDGQLTLGRRL